MGNHWHKPSEKLPELVDDMVVGLWNEPDGVHVEICNYDLDDHKWHDDGSNMGIYATFRRPPDYWTELPEDFEPIEEE